MVVLSRGYMTHHQLVQRLRNRIQIRQLTRPPTWWERIYKWMKEEPMTLIAPPKPTFRKSYVTAYCHKCSDYYDADFGCRCLQVHPILIPPTQEKVYYVELADSE